MNDLEISKALALAIGWVENKLDENGCNDSDIAVFGDFDKEDELKVWNGECWRTFDYRDPAVIWPIAAKYNAFPVLFDGNQIWYANAWNGTTLREEWSYTPEKAVALAVINRNKP
jgi:hypothetical protein